MKNNIFRIIETTTDSKKIAKKITKIILEKGFSPCVQIIDLVNSNYIWKQKLVSTNEYVLKIKSTSDNVKLIRDVIKANTNYEIPEIVSYEFSIENDEYSDWFSKSIL